MYVCVCVRYLRLCVYVCVNMFVYIPVRYLSSLCTCWTFSADAQGVGSHAGGGGRGGRGGRGLAGLGGGGEGGTQGASVTVSDTGHGGEGWIAQ